MGLDITKGVWRYSNSFDCITVDVLGIRSSSKVICERFNEAIQFAEWIVINEYQQIAKVWYFDTTVIANTPQPNFTNYSKKNKHNTCPDSERTAREKLPYNPVEDSHMDIA